MIAGNRIMAWWRRLWISDAERAENEAVKRFWDAMTPRERLIWLQTGTKPERLK